MVDNSILAPVFQQPLALGADISMTSGTKFIGGHSDITAGILSVKDAELAKQVYFFQVGCSTFCLSTTLKLDAPHQSSSWGCCHPGAYPHGSMYENYAPCGPCSAMISFDLSRWRKLGSQNINRWPCLTWEYAMQNAEGAILGPFDCWLAMRGLKTMALRMRRQAASAAIIARWLARHPLVKKVNYPGLPAHPGHNIHVAQASAGGSLLSFETGRCAACCRQAPYL